MTDEQIEKSVLEILEQCLESCNQDGSRPKVIAIDRDNGRVTIELNLVIVEEDEYAGFQGY